MAHLVLGEPVSLDLRVEFDEQVDAGLGPRLAQAAPVEEEIDAQVLLGHHRVICYGEPADACGSSVSWGDLVWSGLAMSRLQPWSVLTW
jgi:hypothetical protein